MWIVEQYGVTHSLLDPVSEDVYMWPHIVKDSYVRAFTTEPCHTILARVLDTATLWRNSLQDGNVHVMPVLNEMSECNLHCLVRISSSPSSLKQILMANDLYVVDAACLPSAVDFIVAIPVRTYRFDEAQHFVVAIRESRVVWSAWTLEEQSIRAQRVPASDTTLYIYMEHSVHLFKRESRMLSEEAIQNLRRGVAKALSSVLPDDVIGIIAYFVGEATTRLRYNELMRGDACGVYNYATGRLLAIAKHRGTEGVPSLRRFGEMSTEERKEQYSTIKRTYRERRRVFGKGWHNKRTRSGAQY